MGNTPSELEPSPFPAPPQKGSWFLSLGANLRSLVIGASCAGCTAAVILGTALLFQSTLSRAIALTMGAMIGSVLLMPFMMFALMKKPIVLGTVIIFGACSAWIVSIRFFAGLYDESATLWALLVYVLACMVCRIGLPNVWPRYLPYVCQKCNYDLRGAKPGKCPECGRAFVGEFALPGRERAEGKPSASAV
ncbi:MAG: hypothetical protein ACKVZJ_15690 [Phycisphaerales bacterium]